MKKENNKLKNKKEQIEFLVLEDHLSDEKTQKVKKSKQKNNDSKKHAEKKIKERKRVNKKNIFIFGVIFAFLIVIYINVIQKSLVRNEIQNLEKLIQVSQIDYNKVEKKLSRTITIGKYKKVERAFKDYLYDIVTTSKEIHNLTDKEKLSNVLSANNLKTDSPNFKKTYQYLKDTRENLNTKFNMLIDLLNKEKIMQYANKQNLSLSYKNFYEDIAIESNKRLYSMQQSLKESLDYYNNIFDTLNNAVKYLKNHRTWKIENNKLIFSSSEDYKEYNKIIETLDE